MTFLRRWWGVFPAALLVALVWPERTFVPIWDGNVYLQCVVDAARTGLNVHSLRCGGHQSQLYMGLLALTQLPRPGNVVAIFAMNVVLALGALAAFASILGRLVPGDAWWVERALVVSLIAVHPLLAASLVQLNSDFGVYVFFAMALACLISRRYWLAAVAGMMLCFSKETGALIYLAALSLHLLFRVSENAGGIVDRARTLAREAAPAMIPLAAFGVFLAWWSATQSSYAVWNQGLHEHPIAGIRLFDFDDPILRGYAAIIFVLGFAWIPTMVILGDVAIGAIRAFAGRRDRTMPGVDARLAGYLAALTAVLVYLLTVYRTFTFPRYFAVLAPLLILAGFVSLVRLGAGPRSRRVALAAMGAVLLSARHSSADPLSRRLFGTLPIGGSSVYDVSGIAHAFRMTNIDHLCYNLQFTGFDWALNAMYAAMRPTAATTIVFTRSNHWGLWGPLDARTFQRAVPRPGTVTPNYADQNMIVALGEKKPRELWLVEQPNDLDTLAVQTLHRSYADADSARYTAGGLTVTARHLVRRDVPVLASGAHR